MGGREGVMCIPFPPQLSQFHYSNVRVKFDGEDGSSQQGFLCLSLQ